MTIRPTTNKTCDKIETVTSEKPARADMMTAQRIPGVSRGISTVSYTHLDVYKRQIRDGCETEINGQGPEIPDRAVQALFTRLNGVKDGDILVLSGSIPDTLSGDMYERIMERQQGKRVKVVAVSYTHLDVYKRQVNSYTIKNAPRGSHCGGRELCR